MQIRAETPSAMMAAATRGRIIARLSVISETMSTAVSGARTTPTNDVSSGRLGQGGRMFGRQAYVGLSDSRFGTVTLGRQYDSVVDYLAQTTANGNWAGYLFAHPYDNDNTDNSFRLGNSVKYASPEIAGFQFGGVYSFSNDTNFANNRAYSFGGQYANGGLLIAAAYLQANNPGAGSTGAITANDASFIAGRMRVFGARHQLHVRFGDRGFCLHQLQL